MIKEVRAFRWYCEVSGCDLNRKGRLCTTEGVARSAMNAHVRIMHPQPLDGQMSIDEANDSLD